MSRAAERGGVDRAPVAELPVIMAPEIAEEMARWGRTEDVAVSADGRWLAVAEFARNEIALVECTVERSAPGGAASAVLLRSMVSVQRPELSRPHGLAFLDDGSVIVANRESEVLLLRCADPGGEVTSRVLIDGTSPVPVSTPGSVAVRFLGAGVAELVVCNNYSDNVTRHLIDLDDDGVVLGGEVLLRDGLALPDGVALSRSGRWLAISNHNTNQVFVYRDDEQLGPGSTPSGSLRGVNYPHGLQFTADERFLLVADAGLPYVHVFAAEDRDWSGRRTPIRSPRVMSDAAFHRGRHNVQEGGPKGLAIMHDEGVVVLTSEYQNLAFFDLAAFTEEPAPRRHDGSASPPTVVLARHLRRLQRRATDAEHQISRLTTAAEHADRRASTASQQHGRAVEELTAVLGAAHGQLEHERRAASAQRAELDEQRRRADELAHVVDALRRSTSWRITAPLRALSDRFPRRRS